MYLALSASSVSATLFFLLVRQNLLEERMLCSQTYNLQIALWDALMLEVVSEKRSVLWSMPLLKAVEEIWWHSEPWKQPADKKHPVRASQVCIQFKKVKVDTHCFPFYYLVKSQHIQVMQWFASSCHTQTVRQYCHRLGAQQQGQGWSNLRLIPPHPL